MKKFKKIIAMCMSALIAMSSMCVGAIALENGMVTSVEVNGVGEGVSDIPPELIDTTIQPYGSSPPGSSASVHNLDSSTYNGDIEWMGSLMYSNKWLKTNKYKIKVSSNFRAYYSKQNAIDKSNPLTVKTTTKFRLVGNDGSSTSWQTVTNTSSDYVTFGITPNTKYYLEISPVNGYYTSGSFTITAIN